MQRRIDTGLHEFDLNGNTGRHRLLGGASREDYMPAFSPDGSQLAWISDRTGPRELWIAKSDGSNPKQITRFDGNRVPFLPSWSPDGQQIVLTLLEGEGVNIFTIRPGSEPQRLTSGLDRRTPANFSADGRYIYYAGIGTSKLEIHRLPVNGGSPELFLPRSTLKFHESRDGKWFYFEENNDVWRLLRQSRDGKKEEEVARLASGIVTDSTWNEQKTFLLVKASHGDTHVRVVEIDHQTKETRIITAQEGLPVEWLGGMTLTPDGTRLVLTVTESDVSDIYLARRD